MNIQLDTATLREKRDATFKWLNATQFFGSFNDNLFKNYLQMFLIAALPNYKDSLLSAATILFAMPFLFFSAFAGYLADRYAKSSVTVALKYAEFVIMSLALVAFVAQSAWMLLILLFLMSVQSALFSPSKFGIVPELVTKERLTRANASLTTWSYLAMIFGAACAPAVAEALSSSDMPNRAVYGLSQVLCVVVAALGIASSRRVWKTPPANLELKPDLVFFRQLWRTTAWVRRDKSIARAVAATGMFALVAGFIQINLVSYGIDHLGLNERVSTFLFFFAAIGIAFGAMTTGRLSRRNIEFGAMPLGAFLLTALVLTLAAIPHGTSRYLVSLFVFIAGFGAGLFVVPLDTFLQMRLPEGKRGEGLALNSFVSWGGVLISGVLFGTLSAAGVSPAARFGFIGAISALLFIGTLFTLQDFFVRMLVTVVLKTAYKVRTIGIENLPVEGPALLVANHASYMDALLLCATSRRRIRFLMAPDMIEKFRFLKPILKLYRVIPVSSASSPAEILKAVREARKALDEGYMVCVFPEGGITRTGTIRSFHRGYELILRGSNYPIIPVYLGGSWGSMSFYYSGQLVRRGFRPTLHRYPVTVLFGEPMPPGTTAFSVRRRVMELSCDYFNARKNEHKSLGRAFVRQARRDWRDKCCDDTSGLKFTWGRLLVASTLLARLIKDRAKGQKHIGILLPPCCPGVMGNVAVALLGKSAVNLNFTVGAAAFKSAIRQTNLQTIITSRKFMERFPDLPIPEGSLVFLEDILKQASTGKKLKALLAARLLPFSMLAGAEETGPDDIAVVIFSSGSTGEPKGVMLSQHNMLSEVEALRMLLATSEKDHMCAALPFFHSFGLMGCIWYPLLTHVRTTFHVNPLDAQTIVGIIRDNKSTMIWGTPTFLQLYLRRASREDFESLRIVLAGGEKLKEGLIQAYLDKFGIRPLEAYGATEMAPGIAVSVPPGTGGGIVQPGYKKGRAGLPCAGIAMKIIDPDTGKELGANEPGLLYLKGPNVMLGYLGREDLTDEVLKDGWYCTGDIAFIDDEGFVGLTDRLSRFSKIGGEMVPHLGVEEAILAATGLGENKLAVTGVPDDKKGERLIVLFTPECGDVNALRSAVEKSNLPNIWRPGRNDWIPVDAIPLLGTGKVDLAALKRLALEKTS